MAKKRASKPLTKAEKFYIEKNCESSNVESLSKDLRRSQSTIQKYYEECLQNVQHLEQIITEQQQDHKIIAGDLMVSNKKRGYTVMTREASEVGESNKQKTNQILSGKLQGHIHTIKD